MKNRREMKLEDLIHKVKKELKNSRYSDAYIEGFVTVWNCLEEYMDRSGKTFFTAKIAIDFLEAEYGVTLCEKLTSKKQTSSKGG